ncbi:Transcription repressor OFP6 [Linum grandiflorum]
MNPNDHLNHDAISNTTDSTKKKKKLKNLFFIGRTRLRSSSSNSNSVCGCGLSDVHDPSFPPITSSAAVPPSPASSINILATLRKHPNSPATSTTPDYNYADVEDDQEAEGGYNRPDLRTDSSSTSITATTATATTTASSSSYSSASSSNGSDQNRKWRSGSVIGSSIAVVKDSEDPYIDFRDSMMRMVEEKGIYSRSGLEELLKRFLELNSPCYHAVIVRAFTQIWNHVVVVGGGGENVSHHGKYRRR